MTYDKFFNPPFMYKKCELTLNYSCNAKCAHCYNPALLSPKPDMDFRKAAVYMMESYKKGARFLSLIGGEPTVYGKLSEIAMLGRKIGYEFILLLSNGIKLSDYGYVKELVQSGVNLFKLSLHSDNPERHNAMMGVDCFGKVVKAIENINTLGVPVALDTVVCGINYKDMPGLLDFSFRDLRVITFNFVACHYQGRAFVNRRNLYVSYSEQAPYLKEATGRFLHYGIVPQAPVFSNYPPCVLPGYEHLMIDWQSNSDDLYLADEGRIGTISEALGRKKIKPEKCARCVYDNVCLGVDAEYVKKYGEDEFIPLETKPRPFPLKMHRQEHFNLKYHLVPGDN